MMDDGEGYDVHFCLMNLNDVRYVPKIPTAFEFVICTTSMRYSQICSITCWHSRSHTSKRSAQLIYGLSWYFDWNYRSSFSHWQYVGYAKLIIFTSWEKVNTRWWWSRLVMVYCMRVDVLDHNWTQCAISQKLASDDGAVFIWRVRAHAGRWIWIIVKTMSY